jgi:undecaprenyl-diphosphatase
MSDCAMSYVEIAILALIQGAAELLPVSSSAHVIVAAMLMGRDPSSPEMTFLIVMLHTGTMFAVLIYFWSRWANRLRLGGKLQFPLMTLLATVVTGIVGLGLMFFIEQVVFVEFLGREKGEVEELFKHLPLVAVALFAVGILIIVSGRREDEAKTMAIGPSNAIWIGLVQGLCLPFRGFSRSGATISTALLRGVSRQLAEDFSFALAVILTPPVILRSVYRHLKANDWGSGGELANLLLPGIVGMVLSFVAGMVALRFLSAMLEQGRWRWFGYYCVAAAPIVALMAWLLPPISKP